MQRLIPILLVSIFSSFSSSAQRILETVLDPAPVHQQSTVYNEKLLIAGSGETFLLSYDDLSFTRINYPTVSGVQLNFESYRNPLTHFESTLFFVLRPESGTSRPGYLYKFERGSFFRIPITGSIVSNLKVYGSFLYFLSNVSGTTKLYRYNGGIVAEVAGAEIPLATLYQIHVSGGNMYITSYGGARRGHVHFIRRYNGSSFLTLPWSSAGTDADGVFAVPGTSRVYFTSHERIIYYDGRTASEVFFNTGESVSARMFQNDLFFVSGVGSTPGRTSYLYRLSGSSLSEVSLPAGYQVAPTGHTNPEIYNGTLCIGTVFSDGSSRVLQYDGISFTLLFNIPTAFPGTDIRLFLRGANLIIQPNLGNGNHAFEYNGSIFTEIIAPAGRLLFAYANSIACNHLWLNYYSDDAGFYFAYGKEIGDCPPPPPPPGPVAVIPDHFRDFERFDMSNFAPERGWCWSEIVIDWEIVPICPVPPCPEDKTNYQAQMLDANNGIAWSVNFSKPSSFNVPLKDEQPFRTILSSLDTKKDLLVFEPDLVQKGIEFIDVHMKPKEGIFILTASTRKNEPVPLKVTLLDEVGEVLWEQIFTAPFTQQIKAKVKEPGKKLVFSIPKEGANILTQTKSPQQLNSVQ